MNVGFSEFSTKIFMKAVDGMTRAEQSGPEEIKLFEGIA
jgi:hypothetical protein